MTTNDSTISGQGVCEEEQVARIAWLYYHGGLTQSKISDRLGLTRLKVSRLLGKGHQSGIICVQINSRFEGCLECETQLRRRFSLQHVRMVPGLADAGVDERLGIGAAHILMSLLQPQQMLTIGFGKVTMSTLQHLSSFIPSRQTCLVTLSGDVGSYMTGIGQLNAACSVNITPAPLRASSVDIARTLKDENRVKDVLLTAQAADMAIVGIGTVSQQDDATITRSGYISQDEQLMIGQKGAVGDILGYFFDAKGDVVTDVKMHSELIGLPLSSLKTTPVRVGVAGGGNKAKAVAAAMKGGHINALVTDQDTAATILRS